MSGAAGDTLLRDDPQDTEVEVVWHGAQQLPGSHTKGELLGDYPMQRQYGNVRIALRTGTHHPKQKYL